MEETKEIKGNEICVFRGTEKKEYKGSHEERVNDINKEQSKMDRMKSTN